MDIGHPGGQTMAKIFQFPSFGVFLGHKEGYISQAALKLDGLCDPDICPVESGQMTVTLKSPVLQSGMSSFSFI